MTQKRCVKSADIAAVEAPAGQPLVSVGIPTFNRPDGLRRTLQLICSQTYKNLEILVSDNASPGPETGELVRQFAAADRRIAYFRQSSNIGPIGNFRFVLSKASGDYFMWAADDDEWDARFIETCLAAAAPSCSVMTRFNTILRASKTSEENPVPRLSPDAPLSENVEKFFSNMQPSLFYGLHHRRSVLFTLKGKYFDFYDCYVVLRIILESGFRTIDDVLYGAGVDTPKREIKRADATSKHLSVWPFFRHSAVALARCPRLSVRQRVRLTLKLMQLVRSLRSHHASKTA